MASTVNPISIVLDGEYTPGTSDLNPNPNPNLNLSLNLNPLPASAPRLTISPVRQSPRDNSPDPWKPEILSSLASPSAFFNASSAHQSHRQKNLLPARDKRATFSSL